MVSLPLGGLISRLMGLGFLDGSIRILNATYGAGARGRSFLSGILAFVAVAALFRPSVAGHVRVPQSDAQSVRVRPSIAALSFEVEKVHCLHEPGQSYQVNRFTTYPTDCAISKSPRETALGLGGFQTVSNEGVE